MKNSYDTTGSANFTPTSGQYHTACTEQLYWVNRLCQQHTARIQAQIGHFERLILPKYSDCQVKLTVLDSVI